MKLTLEEIEKHVNQNEASLDLFECGLTVDDILLMCCYLTNNPNITKLYLQYCKIDTKGAIALATNSTITNLEINSNQIGSEGCKALANNSNITMLDVSDNNIGEEGAKAFAANNTLTALDVSNNNIGSAGAKSLASNTSIKVLVINNNDIDVAGAKALAANKFITHLEFFLNNVREEEAKEFVIALKNNFTLTNLFHDFKDNLIKEKIDKILTRNKVIPWLNTIKHARLMAQAQRSQYCPLGTLPVELLGLINDYTLGANHCSFFIKQFDKRPTSQDLVDATQFALS